MQFAPPGAANVDPAEPEIRDALPAEPEAPPVARKRKKQDVLILHGNNASLELRGTTLYIHWKRGLLFGEERTEKVPVLAIHTVGSRSGLFGGQFVISLDGLERDYTITFGPSQLGAVQHFQTALARFGRTLGLDFCGRQLR